LRAKCPYPLFLFALVGTGSGATAGPVEVLSARLDGLIAPVAQYAAVGLSVHSLDRGDELYARNADVAFVPASNQKLLIAAAALDALGPDFCFTTRVLALGTRHGATLGGDLILHGGGDPTLTTDSLAALADRLAASGIRQVTGRVRGDDSLFDRQRLGKGWSWDDEAFAYAAPISALTLNGNTVAVEVRPAPRPGLPPQVRLDPPAAPSTLRVRAVTAPPGEPSTLQVDRTRARDEITLSGRLPQGSPVVITRVTVEDPPLYAAAVFTALLRAHGVQVVGQPVALGTPAAAVMLSQLQSPPLAQIIRVMDKTSDNLIAETLLKAVVSSQIPVVSSDGYRQEARRAATNGQLATENRQLPSFLERSGLRGPALVIADGSGLSRLDLVSPRNLVRLLVAMDRHPAREAYFSSLPVAGVDGTLRRRMLGSAAVGAVRAKTGTLTHVSALTGVATSRSGERLAFSLLTNNFPGVLTGPGGPRAMEDAVAAALAEFRRE
jgi:D-alanyl-D-alanine carboxypeptidase/D-alanyl-D-alanine-endopeptidase (penicillin-binding protein 4)